MTCCCGREDRNDVDVGVDTCCGPKGGQRRCLCLPYNDPLVVISQIIAIFAFLISWFWWVTFVISATGMTLLQVIWCCRQNKAGLLTSVTVSGIAGILCLACGIYMLIAWKDKTDCMVFIMHTREDDWYDRSDYCPEVGWSIVSFVNFALWLTVTTLMSYFICSGRHGKWETKWRGEGSNTLSSVEMGSVPVTLAAGRTMGSESEMIAVAAVVAPDAGKEDTV